MLIVLRYFTRMNANRSFHGRRHPPGSPDIRAITEGGVGEPGAWGLGSTITGITMLGREPEIDTEGAGDGARAGVRRQCPIILNLYINSSICSGCVPHAGPVAAGPTARSS